MRGIGLSEELVSEFLAEFGKDAPHVAEKALRSVITRRRIGKALEDGSDPAFAVAAALAKDPEFLAEVERLESAGEHPAGNRSDGDPHSQPDARPPESPGDAKDP